MLSQYRITLSYHLSTAHRISGRAALRCLSIWHRIAPYATFVPQRFSRYLGTAHRIASRAPYAL
eukprot:266213-Rhodomonas_salina.1